MSYITKASSNDIANMIEVCKSNLASSKQKDELEKMKDAGFLITELTVDSATSMINDQNNFITLVYKNKDDEVVGYLTACDLLCESEAYQKKVNQIIAKHYPQYSSAKIIYYKQIAKSHQKAKDEPVGLELCQAMVEEAKKRGYSLISCRIVHEPAPNIRSIAFHEKFGFKEHDLFDDPRGIKLGVYILEL